MVGENGVAIHNALRLAAEAKERDTDAVIIRGLGTMVSTASGLTSRQAIVAHNAVLFTADGPNGPLGQIAT